MSIENTALLFERVPAVDGRIFAAYQERGKFDITNRRHITFLEKHGVIPPIATYNDRRI